VVAVETEGLGLQGIQDVSVKDSDPANFGVVGNADGAKGVVGYRGDSSLKLRIENLILVVDFTNMFVCSFYVKSSMSFLHFSDLRTKADCKTLVKLTPGIDLTNMFTCSFYAHRSQKHKKILKTVKSTVFFCAFGIFKC